MTPIYVLELNIEANRIEGVGLIRMAPPVSTLEEPDCRIYSNQHFSRYVYLGKLRSDRSRWTWDQCEFVWLLEPHLVKGSRHLKRGLGLTRLPDRILNNKKLNLLYNLNSMFKPSPLDS